MTAALMSACADPAWYVYAVLPDAAEPAPSSARAITRATAGVWRAGGGILPGASLGLVASAGLAALVSVVSRGAFIAGDPASQAADPDWVAARAAAHHGVVSQALAAQECLPLGFGTLFGSAERLRQWLATNEAALRRALADIAHRREWAATLTGDDDARAAWLRANDPGLQARQDAAAKAGPGAAYLLARQLDRAVLAARAAQDASLRTQLCAQFAESGWRVRAEPGAASWSLLTPKAEDVARALQAEAARLGPMGLALRVTGPWPPYAFARQSWQEPAHD
jgi:hypothetical protein